MKQVLLSFLSILFAASIYAQNSSVKIISKDDGSILNGTTVTVKGWWAANEIKKEFKAVYEDSDSMLIAIKRQEVQIIPGTFDFYCWYLCYAPVEAGTRPIWEADDSLMMYQDDTTSNFSVYMNPQTKDGIAQYRYVFYPENDPTDSSWLDVVFDIGFVGIKDVDELNVELYPNPVQEELNISVPNGMNAENMQLQLFDVTGRMIQTEKLNSGINSIRLNGKIESGTYIVRIIRNEEILLNTQILKE